MTDEEVTYDMARWTLNEWRRELRNIQERNPRSDYDRGMAEGLAKAVREMDRTLSGTPTAASYQQQAMR